MKKRFNKRPALLVFGLLLLGVSLACYVWVRKEQRQYKLTRDLITALLKDDTKQALVLVEAGADPNTKEVPDPAPSLPSLIKQLLHPAPSQAKPSTTAFSIACGSWFGSTQGSDTGLLHELSSLDPRLTQAMLLHGANVNVKDRNKLTALRRRVFYALFASPTEYKKDKQIIKQLLDYGADPDEEDKAITSGFGRTPMQTAVDAASYSNVPRPDLVALLRKYQKHP